MQDATAEVVVAGHICLDIIPAISRREGGMGALLTPGKLVDVGAATISTGGAVSNTGLALHRLGVPTRLMGKIGNDILGKAILESLRQYGPELTGGMIVTEGEASSYTIVISPPGVDRVFLHCPGCNNTFGADDVADERLAGARLFHFGYPPLMRSMFVNGGSELAELLRRVKARGLTTSLDMARPDPDSEAGRVDWAGLLKRALPQVDLFLPSWEELLFMLDRKRFERVLAEAGPDGLLDAIDPELLSELAGRLIGMGVAIAAIKLGDRGLYVRTTADPARLEAMGACAPQDREAWLGRELLTTCFEVDVVGTTGSGDCTIAGFLAGILRGHAPEEVITAAVAVGACNVEQADATSGIPPLATVEARIRSGWARRPNRLALPGWTWDAENSVWSGPGRRA